MRPRIVLPSLLLLFAPLSGAELRFGDRGYTEQGEWSAEATVSASPWQAGMPVKVNATLLVDNTHLNALRRANIRVDGFCLLVTAERTFDEAGRIRLSSDERMSTLLTPTGLPIEGGVQGAVTNRFGYGFRTPYDQYVTATMAQARETSGRTTVDFEVEQKLPDDLPPGIYRVRLDFGVTANKRPYALTGGAFAVRPFFKGRPTESHLYSPPIQARRIFTAITPRVPWVVLANYNSNGYRGVVADEDQPHFGISGRNLIQDDVILPLYDANRRKLSYSLEPQFPTDTIELRSNIPWDYTKGEMTVEVTNPKGVTATIGTFPFVGNKGQWHTTNRSAVTAWKPAEYGYYIVKVTGWTQDIWGNRYEGGGTYRFWIANRMTMATATFQGMAYPVGYKYGRDIGFAPAVPADVDIEAELFVNSDARNARRIKFSGKASPGGLFGGAQGNQQLPLDAPGEYRARILARYWDARGDFWVCSMRHAGIVYPPDSPIVARGKKVTVPGNKYVERGETKFEGYVDELGENHLAHITFPWNQGDVLLIASEGFGANKIEPVLLYEYKDKPMTYDGKLQGVGVSNVRIQTSNGYSPHMFPEFITDWAYYYGAAPRPGFMSRFLVAEDGTRAPYWPTSPNSFGGQINAHANGDMPGDIYRLIGGVAVRKRGEAPAYAGYIASAFLLPKGSNNNRVVAPGSEDVLGPTGEKARVFLVGTRPGMVYETGATFTPAMQIDPILPANINFTLDYPDGRRVFASGTGDGFGSFAGKDRWPLDIPGIYRYQLSADWHGHRAIMPGLPATGGELYVIEKDRPAGEAGLVLDLPSESSFNPAVGVNIAGRSTGSSVYYAAVIPGAVIDQGYLTVTGGKFQYFFNPKAINDKIHTYDTAHRVTGRPELGDVVHLTFFSKESGAGGAPYHAFARVIMRGPKVIVTK